MIPTINAVVLFVQDLAGCTKFYQNTLGLEPTFSDADSVAFRLQDRDFVLLKVSAAVQMLTEEALSLYKEVGRRVLLCAGVEDVDVVYKALTDKGVEFIKPPISQPWGRRTAYFADPEGNLWEIYHHLAAE